MVGVSTSSDETTSTTPKNAPSPTALTNVGPTPDPTYYRSTAASKGVSTNASLVPASDLAMTKLIFGGLNADPYDFAMSVMSNSNIPVTSVNQQSVRPASKTTASGDYWKQVLMGKGLTQSLGTLPVNSTTKGLPSIGILGVELNNFVSSINPLT